MSVVPDNQLQPTHDNCPVCGDEHFCDAPVVLRLQEDPVVSMKQCQRCFACSADRMPMESFLRDLYEPSIYQSSLTHDEGLTRKCAANIQRLFKKDNIQGIDILDYGGGNGSLARLLCKNLTRQLGGTIPVTAIVVDIHPRDAESDLSFITVDEFLSSEKKYDVLIASAVLEHIPHLQPVLEKLCRAGKEGALFYARTPYDAPLANYVPHYHIKWPRHVHDMGPQFWSEFANRMPLQILESRTSIVESSFTDRPLQTLLAYILKAPSLFETGLLNKLLRRETVCWRFVGGWEVFLEIGSS